MSDHYNLELIDSDKIKPCGDCQACCFTHGVHDTEFDKRHFTRCSHQCPNGCGIYNNRPEPCRSYHCWWKTGKFGNTKFRPDKLGLVIDYNPVADVFNAWEVRKGIATTKKALRAIRALRKEYGREVLIVDKSVVDFSLTLPKEKYDREVERMATGMVEKMEALMRAD